MPEMGGYTPADHASRHQDGGRDEISIANLSGTPAALTTHEADVDAHMADLFQKLRTGEYHHPAPIYSSGTVALVADTIYAIPFFIAKALTIDRLAIEVVTGDSGKIARLGVYQDGTNLYPGALVKDYNTVSVASTAIVAASGDQALTKGLYWLVAVSDGAPTIRYIEIIGSPLGTQGTTYLNQARLWGHWYKAGVGSAALDDPFVSGASLGTNQSIAIVFRPKS